MTTTNSKTDRRITRVISGRNAILRTVYFTTPSGSYELAQFNGGRLEYYKQDPADGLFSWVCYVDEKLPLMRRSLERIWESGMAVIAKHTTSERVECDVTVW